MRLWLAWARWARPRSIKRANAGRASSASIDMSRRTRWAPATADTRITREAIGEGDFYVPLVQRSNAIWRELESSGGRTLFHRSGGLIIALPSTGAKFHGEGDFVEASARVAGGHGVAHDVLDAAEIKRRHPLLKPRASDRAYFEHGAGVLRPERCISTQLELARRAGATIQTGERVTGYEARADGLSVTTERGPLSSRGADPGGGRLDG